MKYNKIILFLLGALLMLASCVREESVEQVQNPSEGEAFAAGEIFVKFTPQVASMLEESGIVRSEVSRSGVQSVDELLDIVGGDFAQTTIGTPQLIAGFVTAFIVGCLACRYMISIVKRGKLIWFALYCAVVGLVAIGSYIF